MVDRDAFDARLARLETLLVRLRRLATIDRDAFLADAGIQAQAERWLQLAGEVAIDLAHHLIASRGWATPATYRQAFTILRQNGVLDHQLAHHMEGWAGLRNILVHLYLDVDHEQLHRVLRDELGQLADYAAAMARAHGL